VILARDGTALYADADPWSQVETAIRSQGRDAEQTFFFANLESPVYDPGQNIPKANSIGYDLCANSDQLSILTDGGISLVNLANNHQADCGQSAAETMPQLAAQHGFAVVGPGIKPIYLETKAGKIGILAAEDITQPIDDKLFLSALQDARSQCDILIASLHWGNEYQSGTTQRQRDLAQELADAGVDVLWGTHPHVLQPINWITSSNGKHQMLVMNSLGNLLADQYMNAATQESALVTVIIRNKKIVALSILPIEMERASRKLILPDQQTTESIEDQIGVNGLAKKGINLFLPVN
jgi:poly-gamma-glutamate capsule biosynthesis protein CapA/YwtB (metallophosphatase superfamily)